MTSSDDIATSIASGYFDTWLPPFKVGDVIYLHATDGDTFRAVTAITPNVTVAALV